MHVTIPCFAVLVFTFWHFYPYILHVCVPSLLAYQSFLMYLHNYNETGKIRQILEDDEPGGVYDNDDGVSR